MRPEQNNCYEMNGTYIGKCGGVKTETVTGRFGVREETYTKATFTDNYGRQIVIDESNFRYLREVTCKLTELYLSQLSEFTNSGMHPDGSGLKRDEKYYYKNKLWKVSNIEHIPRREGMTAKYTLETVDKSSGSSDTITISLNDAVYKSLISEKIIKQYDELSARLANTLQDEVSSYNKTIESIDEEIRKINATFYISGNKTSDIKYLEDKKQRIQSELARTMDSYTTELRKVAEHHPLRSQKAELGMPDQSYVTPVGASGNNSSSSNSSSASSVPLYSATAPATATASPYTMAIKPTNDLNNLENAIDPRLYGTGNRTNITNAVTPTVAPTGTISGGRRRKSRKSRKARNIQKSRKAKKVKKQSRRRV